MLNKPQQDLPPLSDGDVQDILNTFGQEKPAQNDKKQRIDEILPINTDEVSDLPKMKSTDNPPTERINPTEKESGNSGASAPVGNRQSNSDQLPSSLISSGQDAFADITSKKENDAVQKA